MHYYKKTIKKRPVKFKRILNIILKLEGGYVNDPNDPGGETNYGITKNVASKFGIVDMKNMKVEEAKKIYYELYYRPYMFHFFELPLALVLFDFAVNSGPKTAIKGLQRVLKDVVVDGIIGKKTIHSVLSKNQLTLSYKLIEYRKEFYDHIIENNPKLKKFRKGWMRRLQILEKEIKKYEREVLGKK